jgi:DNA-binding FadR family transcriptional regulator
VTVDPATAYNSIAQWNAAGMASDGLTLAVEDYQRAQDELVEARNRLAQAIAGAAMSGMTQDEIVELTGYTADRVLRICTGAGVSGD